MISIINNPFNCRPFIHKSIDLKGYLALADYKSNKPKIRDIIKKGDIILAVFFIIAGLVPMFFMFQNEEPGHNINVSVNSKHYGSYSLDKDRTIKIKQPNGHINIIEIKNGKAYMKYSDCKNQNCVHQGKINSNNQNIVCLPNKVMVTVDSDKKQEFDSVSK